MNDWNHRTWETTKPEDALESIITKIEQQAGSKVRRVVREAEHEGKFFMTIILENYKLIEVCLHPSTVRVMGHPTLEVDIEAY
jgi:hypothetical protein